MKKYFTAALSLLGAVALMLAGMYVYSQPDNGGDEALVTKNIIVGSVEIESCGGDSFYVLRDKFGSEYIFNRLPERMRSESYEGRSAQVRCTPADSSGRRLLRELSIDGKVLISSGDAGGSGPELAHIMGAVIITAGFLLLWLFVRRVIRMAAEKDRRKDGF